MAAKKQTIAKGTVKKEDVPTVVAKINRLVNREDNNIKAITSVNIGGAFAVHGIKVIDSPKGLFVSMPSNSYVDREGRTQYSDICHPITAEARTELIDTVKEAYEQALEEQQTEEEAEEEAETEVQGQGQSQQM